MHCGGITFRGGFGLVMHCLDSCSTEIRVGDMRYQTGFPVGGNGSFPAHSYGF